jgi:hypothetical protein
VQGEFCALSRLAVDRDPAAVSLDDPLRDGQSQPAAARVARPVSVGPIEALEDVRQMFGGDSLPVICDPDSDAIPLGVRPKLNLATRARVREGIVYDIHKGLEKPILVNRSSKVLGRVHGEGHLLCRPLGLDRLCDEAEQRGDSNLLASQEFGSGFGSRQHKEVSHQPGQAAHRLLQGV